MKNPRFNGSRLSEFIGLDRDDASWEIIPGMTLSNQVSDDATFSSGIIPLHSDVRMNLGNPEEAGLVPAFD
jgi:hypothetical protein